LFLTFRFPALFRTSALNFFFADLITGMVENNSRPLAQIQVPAIIENIWLDSLLKIVLDCFSEDSQQSSPPRQ
jgi:hypothetical protein